MKELSIEEKAKAYDEAIKKAESLYKVAEPMSACNVIIETLFPELAESEDEKIKRCISDAVRKYGVEFATGTITKEKMLAWLEKQCEQNLEWSKEENDKISNIIAWIKDYPRLAKFNEEAFVKANNYAEWIKSIRNKYIPQKQGMCKLSHDDEIMIEQLTEYFTTCKGLQNTNETIIEWLKSLKDRVVPQPKQEWSEEDEKKVDGIITILKPLHETECDYDKYKNNLIDWLKSLKDRYTWKPSDEQMRALLSKLPVVKGGGDKVQNILETLYNDLKAL